MSKGFSSRSGILMAVLIAAAVILNARVGPLQAGRVWIWLATAGLMVGVMATIGYALNGRYDGVIVDNRMKVSLSKFQMALWTVVVTSALATAVAINLYAPAIADPLKIAIPGELLAALGIAGFSLVATPAILSTKANTPATPADTVAVQDQLNLKVGDLSAAGKVFGRSAASLAEWADMFRGDEVGNAAQVDLSKVQQFLITVLLVVVYGADIARRFMSGEPVTTLPPLSEGFLWLMGISHASYLTFKAVPHTRTGV